MANKNAFFTDTDTGFKEFMTRMSVTSGADSVFIGILRSSGTYKNKKERGGKAPEAITMAQLAATHEFGSRDGRIPERSFMRSTIDAEGTRITKLTQVLSDQMVIGTMTRKRALGLLGQFVSQLMKAKITAGVPPPNAPSTVAAKGSDKPLIDTGQLINSIEWEIREAGK